MAKTKKEQIRADIEKDLLDQLERNGTVGRYYADLVKDYMSMWDTKEKLVVDIGIRGVVVETITNAGVINLKKNDSVADLVRINAQMLKLLSELGITPAKLDGVADEEM